MTNNSDVAESPEKAEEAAQTTAAGFKAKAPADEEKPETFAGLKTKVVKRKRGKKS